MKTALRFFKIIEATDAPGPHGSVVSWRYAVTAEDVESGMLPCREYGDYFYFLP